QHARSDVSSVGIANTNNMVRVEFVIADRRGDKIRQLIRSRLQILQIEHTLSQSAKKTRHSVLENFSARTEQRSVRIEFAPQREEIPFVSSRSMQQQQRSARVTGNEFVKE